MPRTFAIVSMPLAAIMLQACGLSATRAGVTDGAPVAAELCRSWGDSLPTRSRADTPQTADEIGLAYANFAAACPAWTHLIP